MLHLAIRYLVTDIENVCACTCLEERVFYLMRLGLAPCESSACALEPSEE